MNGTAATLAGLFLTVYLVWRTVHVLLRFNAWLIAPVLLLDLALAFVSLGTGFPVGFVVWKLWFFYAAFSWEPVRGLFRQPRWPRRPLMRGPGKRKRREFSEPMPWTRGPSSF